MENPQSLRSGGQGDLTTKQNIHTAKAIMRFNPMEDGFGITHQPTLGSEVSYTKGTYKRDKDYYRYRFIGTADNIQWIGSADHITRFQSGTHSADYTSYAIFLDDNLQYGKLNLRPGIRLDRDDFVNRTNIAPRITGTYDVFGNNETLLIAG